MKKWAKMQKENMFFFLFPDYYRIFAITNKLRPYETYNK